MMTPEEAINILEIIKGIIEWDFPLDYQLAIDKAIKAIKALQKNAPTQPELTQMVIGKSKGGITMHYQCIKCGEQCDPGDSYCRRCGRKFERKFNG